MIVQVNNNSFK